MCITFFTIQPQCGKKNNVQFVIGFNRDEQTKRQTDRFGPFTQDNNIYAGKDQISGGSWLGINIKTGIMVILTNYDLPEQKVGRSRGKLVLRSLKTETYQKLELHEYNAHIHDYLVKILKDRQTYSAFNLMIYSIRTETVFYICSQLKQQQPRVLKKSVFHGFSNHQIDITWPKTTLGLQLFEEKVKQMNFQDRNDVFAKITQVMQNKRIFNEDPASQSAIFVLPYYNQAQKRQRMTKCSFMAIVRKNSQAQFQINMRQTTYQSPDLKQSYVQFTKTIGNSKQNHKQ